VGWSVIDRPTVWYLTDVLIIIGCRIHFWTDVLRCCGGKFSIRTYIWSPDEGGTEFCATWCCHCMWCAEFNFFLSYPAHWQDKHKVMAENLNLKEKSVWISYNFCCCEFLQMWVVVSPALQVTLSRVKKRTAGYRMGNWLATEVFLSQLAIRVPCISTQYWLM
jgi:hypothetical protein